MTLVIAPIDLSIDFDSCVDKQSDGPHERSGHNQ